MEKAPSNFRKSKFFGIFRNFADRKSPPLLAIANVLTHLLQSLLELLDALHLHLLLFLTEGRGHVPTMNQLFTLNIPLLFFPVFFFFNQPK